MRKSMIALALCLVIGCQVNRAAIQKTATETSNGVSKIQAYLDTAASDLNAIATSSVSQAVALQIGSAQKAIKSAIDESTAALTSLAKLNEQVSKLNDVVVKQNTIIEEYHRQWIGDRLKFWWHVALAAWVGLGITAIVLRVIAGGLLTGGFAARAATELIRFLPLGNLFAWTANFFVKKKAVGAA